MPFSMKYSAQALRCSNVIISALLTSNKFLFALFTSFTYLSRSSDRNMSGFLASTICTTRSERSMTRQSCLQTSRFRSKGVMSRSSTSCNSARPLRHSSNASRSLSSSSRGVVCSSHLGRLGTVNRALFAFIFLTLLLSSAALSKYGFRWSVCMILTLFIFSAVKSVPANSAVLRNSSSAPCSVTERILTHSASFLPGVTYWFPA